MAAGRVTTVDETLGRRGDATSTTLRAHVLEQVAARLAPGETIRRRLDGAHEVLFVSSGAGSLTVNGEAHVLAAETAAFLVEGDEIEIAAEAPAGLEVIGTRFPPESQDPVRSRVTVRCADRPAQSAGIGREFRLLVDEEAGCREVTQFVGVVPPGRAPMHSHAYDELAYVVEGRGALHWEDGTKVPVRRGSCIHFPRLVRHSLENLGETPLRIMGVFHPSGSPAARASEGNKLERNASQSLSKAFQSSLREGGKV